jgi:hypothetical protein
VVALVAGYRWLKREMQPLEKASKSAHIFGWLHLFLHLAMQFTHFIQADKTLKHRVLHSATVAFEKRSTA